MGVEVRRQTKKMHWHDGAGFRGDGGFDFDGVDVVGFRIDVDEDGFCADPGDGAGGGNKAERRGDDFIARADACGKQRED